MTTVLLYGHLGKLYGKKHVFNIQSAAEAIKALKANFKGFERYLIDHSSPGYYIFAGKENLGANELKRNVSKTIKIVPVVEGAAEGQSSGKAIFSIILGIILVWVAPEFPAGYELIGSAFAGLGISLILGGITSLLFKPPEYKPLEDPNNQPSYSFDGPVNTTAQGNPVPVCYGKLRVGSQVISAGLFTDQLIQISTQPPSKFS